MPVVKWRVDSVLSEGRISGAVVGTGYAACKHVALLNSFISSKSANKVRFNYVRLNGACRQQKKGNEEQVEEHEVGEGEAVSSDVAKGMRAHTYKHTQTHTYCGALAELL